MESNRLRRATVGVLAAVCLAAGYLASTAEAGATKVQAIEGITEYKLDNGLHGVAVSRRLEADGHGQPDGARRLAP